MGIVRGVLLFLSAVFTAALNVGLARALICANEEKHEIMSKSDDLRKKYNAAHEQFLLKQDHMRTILSAEEFTRDVIRQKEGYVRSDETVFRFEN